MKHTIKTIIFDWDGTIAMTLHLWLDAWKAELKRYDIAYPDDHIVQDFFYEHDKAQIKYPQINFELSGINVRQRVENTLGSLALYNGAKDALLQITGRGVQTALVTSSSRALVEKGLGLHGLHQHFQSVVAGDDGYGHKPTPHSFNETLKRLGAKPETTLVIGDAAPDILAARAAKCQSCLFIPAENVVFQDRDYLMSLTPDFTLEAFSQIGNLFHP
jgi:pyrophosphatase PpaX